MRFSDHFSSHIAFLKAEEAILKNAPAEELQALVEINPEILSLLSPRKDSVSLLKFCVLHKKYDALSVLLEAGADPQLEAELALGTPLISAIKQHDTEAVRILLACKRTNPNTPFTMTHIPPILEATFSAKAKEIIDQLTQEKIVLYMPSCPGSVLLGCGINRIPDELILRILEQYPFLSRVFSLAINADLSGLSALLNATVMPTQLVALLEYERFLQDIFLILVNTHRFEAAQVLFGYLNTTCRKTKNESQVEKKSNTRHPEWKDYASSLVVDEKTAPFKAIFNQMVALLENPARCLVLLEKLDRDLSVFFPEMKDIVPGEGYTLIYDFHLPSAPTASQSTIKTYHLFRCLLREQLEKFGIEKQSELYTFSGFVQPQAADCILKSGALFKEQFLRGNALLHGVYSHYLQWYLFSRAVEEGDITLPPGIRLVDVLFQAVVMKGEDDPVWNKLIDLVEKPLFEKGDNLHYLGSPHRLNALLLCAPELPHLRGFLLNQWYKNIHKLQDLCMTLYNKSISYECIIGAMAFSANIFNAFSLGYDNRQVKKYYPKTVKFNVSTGIVVKDAAQFVWTRRYRLFPTPTAIVENHPIESPEEVAKKPIVPAPPKAKVSCFC